MLGVFILYYGKFVRKCSFDTGLIKIISKKMGGKSFNYSPVSVPYTK